MLDFAGLKTNVPLRFYSTLKAGGNAETFYHAQSADDLAQISILAQVQNVPTTILGWGSNILPSDNGVPGLTVWNTANTIKIEGENVVADCGAAFQDLFLKTAQQGLGGLEFAVGIPGTVGGALVSNAGAYRSNVSEFLTEIEVVHNGERKWIEPSFMEFSYRDSLLRRPNAPALTLVRIKMSLPRRNPKDIYDEARDYQRQRISKQPPSASAGSFFKNVVNHDLAKEIEGLTPGMRANGVIPAGFLIEQCGLKGTRFGGAMIGAKHANFLLNVAGATATELRRLAEHAAAQVRNKFAVDLEEEALYLGDWSNWQSTGALG